MNFKSLYLCSSTSLVIKVGTITINPFLSMRHKSVYSCSIQINASWTFGKHFLFLAGCRSIFPAKSCWDAWRSCSWLMRGQVNIVDEAKLYSLIYLNFEALVVRRVVGSVMEKNWAHSVDPCQRQVLQFSVHLIDLLSILLRWDSFAGIQKAVVGQAGSRPPNSDCDLFLV